MSTHGTYLAVFLSNKKSARWQAWYAMSEAERGAPRTRTRLGSPR